VIDMSASRPGAFPSLAALRQAHVDLLQRHRADPAEPRFDEIDALVAAAVASGALLDRESDRWEAQGIIDYWLAVLYRARREPPQGILLPFDPSLAPELPDERCPYRGLEAFGEAQHNLFFGRRRVVSEMVKRVTTGRLIAIVGASGSGKSSLALAGLIPALKGGAVPAQGDAAGSADWVYLPRIVPGIHPLSSLATLVLERTTPATIAQEAAALAADSRRFATLLDRNKVPVVVTVDQFEEVFTLCTDAAERSAFVDSLLSVTRATAVPHRVVLTMRSDFDVQVASLPALQAVFDSAQYRIPAFNAVELREAIEKPAELVGLKFEEGIVDRLVNQILGEPAGLPLLQFALLKLWERRERNRVTLATYQEVGGPMKALERSADELYASLLPEEQVTARRILMRIVRPGNSLEVTSNRVLRESVQGSEPRERVDRVLDKLIDAGLLRQTGDPSGGQVQIEVAHEALLRNWPRLVEWLEDERVRLRRRFSLTAAAQQWAAHGKDPGGLLGGSLLEEARTYDDLDATEREFVEESASVVASESRQRERRLQILAALLVVLLALAAGLGWAVYQLKSAVQAKDAALKAKEAEANSTRLALSAADQALRERLAAATQAEHALATAEKAVDEASRVVQNAAASSGGEKKLLTAKNAIRETQLRIGARARPEYGDAVKGAVDSAPAETAPNEPATAAPPPQVPAKGQREPAAGEPAPARRSLFDGVQIRASSTSTGSVVDNTTLPLYNFRIWLEGSPEALARIKRVQYEFNHPTFREKVQTSEDRGSRFERGYAGWGCLSVVKVTVFGTDPQAAAESVNFDMCAAVQFRYSK
jgi:energy-coupling factor transporter ATP-binding protein EcfA2